jgi:hypothetical protein
MSVSSHRIIENLIATYAELVDGGDFAGLGALLAEATFTGGDTPVSGARWHREDVPRHPDRLRRRHPTDQTHHHQRHRRHRRRHRHGDLTRILTALQALPDLPLQPIASGRYHDRFALLEGRWRFVELRVHVDLVGDVSRHLRHAAAER